VLLGVKTKLSSIVISISLKLTKENVLPREAVEIPIFIALAVRYNQIVNLSHHGGSRGVGKINCSPVVGLGPGIFGGELVEAAAVDADDDVGGGEERVGGFEGAGVFESVELE